MKVFSQALLDDIAVKATASPRQRAHQNMHSSTSDLVQRFFVAANRSTYFRPHRHHTKSEMALVLRGTFDVITFDDAGTIAARYVIGEGTPNFGYEMPQLTWHALIAHEDGAAFVEVKEGPYDPATATEFAPWAPAEDDVSAAQFLERLRVGN
jgi:hypothetical protein